jgi:hypothetical protein
MQIVYAYDSPQSAQAALQSDFAYFHEGWSVSQSSNYTASNLTGVGDEAHIFTIDYVDERYGGQTRSTVVGIRFRHGNYEVSLLEDFAKSTASRADMLAAISGLAHIVDGRIQANG